MSHLSPSHSHKWVLHTPASFASSPTITARSSIQTWDQIAHIPEVHALICRECRVLVPMTLLSRHLQSSHQRVPARRRREIEAKFRDLPVIQTWQEVQPRPDHSHPLSYLKGPLPGFPCPYCTTFKTTSRDCLRHHRLLQHPDHRGHSDSATTTYLL